MLAAVVAGTAVVVVAGIAVAVVTVPPLAVARVALSLRYFGYFFEILSGPYGLRAHSLSMQREHGFEVIT